MNKNIFVFTFLFFTLTSLAFSQTNLEKKIYKLYDKLEGDSLKPKKNSFFAVPIWGAYPETGWQIGLSLVYLYRHSIDSVTRPSIIRFNTQYTQLNQYSFRPFIDVFTKNNKYNFKAIYLYKYFNEYYWGIGNKSNNSKSLFDFSQNRLQLRATKQMFKSVYLGVQADFNYMGDFKGDSIFNNDNLIGINNSFTSGLGAVVSFDNRDKIYFPTKGHFIDISTLFNQQIFGSQFQYNNLTIDARQYIKIWKNNILAFQAFGNFNEGNIPFKQLATIGSDSYLRGYYNGRFRDNHAMALQAELRKQVWGPISITIFGGFGNVANKALLLFENPKFNYGVGYRFLAIKREHVNIRIDYGRGENGIQGLYFTMNEAF
jgi:hypothetical protein